MDRNLILKGAAKYLSGFVLTAVLIFLPAGTLEFFGGWLFMGGSVYTHADNRDCA